MRVTDSHFRAIGQSARSGKAQVHKPFASYISAKITAWGRCVSRHVRWTFAPFVCLPLVSLSAGAQDSAKPAVNNLHDIAQALSTCMQPLAVSQTYRGIQITVRIGFDVRGQPLGPPRFAYVTPNAPNQIKNAYRNAISDGLKRCAPLSFSSKLGTTIAGVPIILRFNEGGLMHARLAESSTYVAAAPLPSSQVPPERPVPPIMPSPMQQQRPPIWLPGLAGPVPSPPPGPGMSQDRQARCIHQARLYGVPAVDLAQYLSLCTQ